MSNGTYSGPLHLVACLWVALLFLLTIPSPLFAQSSIQGTVSNSPGKIENSTNVAAGADNRARQFSITLKNGRVSGTVVNAARGKTAMNLAVGKRNSANQGSIAINRGIIKGSSLNSGVVKSSNNLVVGSRNQANQSAIIINQTKVTGKLVNSGSNTSSVNMSIGRDNAADQETVRVYNSRIRGSAINNATVQKSANLAVGKKNSVAQAAIVLGKTKLGGVAVNTATVEDAVNDAMGYGNEAIQSSIVVGNDQAGNSISLETQQSSFPTRSGHVGEGVVNLLPAPVTAPDGPMAKPISSGGKKRLVDEKTVQTAPHVPGQVVFLVNNDKAGLASLDRVAGKYHLNVATRTVLKSLHQIMVVSTTGGNPEEVAEALNGEAGITVSQPNYVFETMGQSDPLRPMQNLDSMLDLTKVHNRVRGKNITVAVVDTGVELEHQDLRGRIIGYQNFITESEYKGEIHGTAVAGIIGAEENEYGIVGIAPDVFLLALRACRQLRLSSSAGECFSTSLVQAIDAAISARANLVNLSLGAHVKDMILGMVIESGYEKEILFAAPVGNDPKAEEIAFPASHDRVISIAGLDEKGRPLPNRRLASLADAVAPATHLFVTTPGNSYNFIDGTSFASASISGILALSMENNTLHSPPCLPRFNSGVAWPRQVLTCIEE